MPTTVRRAADSIDPDGPLLMPNDITVTYGGPPGLAVWRDVGEPIITTLNEMRQFTSLRSTFGRDPIVDSPTERFFNSNDVQRGEFDVRVDPVRNGAKDRDGDGLDMDTFYFRFSDLADVDRTGVDLWFNDVRVHINPQANAETDVFAVRTDANEINIRWDSGTDDRPDGFAMSLDCVEIL